MLGVTNPLDGLALVGDPGAPGRVTMLTLEMFFNVFFIIECGLMIIAYGFASLFSSSLVQVVMIDTH